MSHKCRPLSICPRLELEQRRTILFDTERLLQIKKEEYKSRREELDLQWHNLVIECRLLKEKFTCFSRFIYVNEEKRKRSIQAIEHNRKLIAEKNIAIKDIQKKMEYLRHLKVEMEEEVKKHSIYENYLNEFLTSCEKQHNFKNLYSIIERYVYYRELNRHFASKQSLFFLELQTGQTQLDHYYKAKRDQLIGFYCQIGHLRRLYNDATRKAHLLELSVRNIQETIVQKYMDLKTAKMSVWNLYVMMCKKRQKIPKLSKDNVREQLLFVNRTLRTYQKLVKKLKKSRQPTLLKPALKRPTK